MDNSLNVFTPLNIDTSRMKIIPLSSVAWQKIADGVLYENSFHSQMWGMKTPEDIKKSYENSIKRVEFRIDAENFISQKAIERIGAQFEGLLRNRTINAKGISRDYKFYSVIDTDCPYFKFNL
jgi:hypothetical protein